MEARQKFAQNTQSSLPMENANFENLGLAKILTRVNQFATTETIIAISIGIIYLWFGALKFFPGLSPAEQLAQSTITALTFGLIAPSVSIILLAIWEVTVGFCLIAGIFKRFATRIAILHILLTFTPLVILPDLCFTIAPFGLTLLGQYIIKNILILGALVILWRMGKQSKE